MKFLYEYRTSDNVKHNGVICAADRDAAYAALKKQGIKPSRFAEAPGFFNKLFGKGKRWLAIVVLGAAVVVAAFVIQSNNRTIRTIEQSQTSPLPRHQIYGEPTYLAELERADYAPLFALAGERALARFAIPGTLYRFPDPDARARMIAALPAILTNEIAVAADDRREAAELKRVVSGMKDELRRYLANGNGTCASYVRRLEERQRHELDVYLTVERELAKEKSPAVWESRNATLRRAGLPTIVRPDEKE